MHAAVHIRNRTSSEGADGIPYQLLYGSPPDRLHLRVFGYKAYVHIPRELRRKMDDMAWLGVFLGYPVDSPGYLIFNPRSRKIVTAANVQFDETTYYYENRRFAFGETVYEHEIRQPLFDGESEHD
eukprot:scaffold558502_cov32-Prasinocladus_malaysianus.AAC.1